MKKDIHSLLLKKNRGEKIVSLTAYDYITARLEEEAGVDFILVGDSIAMAVFGEETTLCADLDAMIIHTRAVSRGAANTLIVGDMPFGSYERSDSQAVKNAVRFLSEGGADAVKLEGGNNRSLSRARAIIDSGIPVMGHVGLLPQSIKQAGGYKVVYSDKRDELFEEAFALQQAGVFSIVFECIEEELAAELTGKLEVPTIGIGAGRYTDGQILVVNDMLGLSGDFEPRFVKQYVKLDDMIIKALKQFSLEVRDGNFPADGNVYHSREEK
ncbi:MAG: 3-methyl-2-oxobutanoate hydroxymethyltransferase [Candidatus Aegiribacteria sp.]|nr:3-methyl-2-oxobutanoate hydroxymethyltransferase [Candidatus Aegiribacteria sp.]